MGDYSEIIYHFASFAVFVIFIIIIAAISLKLYLKKFKFTPQKSRVYGIIHALDNKSIIAFSLVTLNYLFLTWCAMTTVEMNIVYVSVILILTLLSSTLVKDYIKLPLNLLISLVNCFALYIVHFVHIYLSGEVGDIFMRISIFLIIAFAFIYFTYNYINDINDIVQKNKHIKKKSRWK